MVENGEKEEIKGDGGKRGKGETWRESVREERETRGAENRRERKRKRKKGMWRTRKEENVKERREDGR